MRNPILIIFISFTSSMLFAQTNTFPSSGNVGVGTTSPTSKLEISGTTVDMMKVTSTSHSIFAVESTGTGVNPYIRLLKSGATKWSFCSDYNTDRLQVSSEDGTTRMIINQNGNIGIGATNPVSKLHVGGGVITASDVSYNNINVRLDGSSIPTLRFTRWTGSANINQNAFVGQYFNETTQAYELGLGTASSATGDQNANSMIMTLNLNGNVGIGTTTPGSFKLAVEGKIGAREVNVTTTTPWPDYVFESTYNLPTLEELNAYIKINKHLPEVPSACAMEANGVNLGEMNMLLLKKVEELTLYVIEQNAKYEKQQIELEKQRIELTSIKETLNK